MMALRRESARFMVALATLTTGWRAIAYPRVHLDTQGMRFRRIWSVRGELAFWAAWGVGLAAFAMLAVWVSGHYAASVDRRVTFEVQELYRYPWADELFGRANDAGAFDVVAGVVLAAFVVLLVRGLRFEALVVAGAVPMHYAQVAVGELVHRPEQQFLAMRATFDGLLPPRMYPDPYGFPSGHVFGEVLVYGLIFAYAPRALGPRPLAWLVRLACVAEIGVGGAARMYTGAHWFTDVAGAALLAVLYLALAWRIDRVVLHLRAVADERQLAAAAGITGAPLTTAETPIETEAARSAIEATPSGRTRRRAGERVR